MTQSAWKVKIGDRNSKLGAARGAVERRKQAISSNLSNDASFDYRNKPRMLNPMTTMPIAAITIDMIQILS